MAQRHEAVVVQVVLAQSADGHRHAVAEVTVQLRLGPVILLEVDDERLRRRRQVQLLRPARVGCPARQDLVLGGLTFEAYGHCRQVPIADRDPDALRRDQRALRRDDGAILNRAPDLQRLTDALLLLAANVRDNVVHHLRPQGEGLAGARDGLVGAHGHLARAEVPQRIESRYVRLDGAVRLDRDEAATGPEATALGRDDLEMFRVDLRDDHGHVRGPAVGGVRRHHGHLLERIGVLKLADFVLRHIDGAEDEIDLGRDALDLGRVAHLEPTDRLRQRPGHGPTLPDGLRVRSAGRPGAGRHAGHLKPRMIRQQGDELLTDHSRGADDPGAQSAAHAVQSPGAMLCSSLWSACPVCPGGRVSQPKNPATERISRTGSATLVLVMPQTQDPPATQPQTHDAGRRPRVAPAVLVVWAFVTLGPLRQTCLRARLRHRKT